MLEIKKNNVSKNEEPLMGSFVNWTRPRIYEDIITEISETKKQKRKKNPEKTSQYPRTVRQLQKV